MTSMQSKAALATLPQRIHMIGISGIGLSAIARILVARGYVVSGSDLRASEITHELNKLGIRTFVGHAPEQLGDAQLVVASSAIPEHNCELVAARERGLPVMWRREFLRPLLAKDEMIAVAGTHGKTTTSAMIATILQGLGRDPGYIVGGIIAGLGTNAHAGTGQHFVIEADEYDRMFHGLDPSIAVVTHIEMDHPDCYPTMADMKQAYVQFLRQVQPDGAIIAWDGSPVLRDVLAEIEHDGPRRLTYGGPAADYVVGQISGNARGGVDFPIMHKGLEWAQVSLSVPGAHNALNATAALVASSLCGVPVGEATEQLAGFQGALRRFQVTGDRLGVTVIDDYAHHPTEVRATLAAARLRYGHRRLMAVFQPHTFSRTKALWDELLGCFGDADELIITDIYRARAKERESVDARGLAEAIEHDSVRYLAALSEVADWLESRLRPGDVLITLGAGDVNWVGEEILSRLGRP